MGGQSQGSTPAVLNYTVPNQGQAAQNSFGGINTLGSYGQNMSDVIGATGLTNYLTQNFGVGNQALQPGIQTAQQVAPGATNFANTAQGTAGNFIGGANSLVPYAQNVMNMGLDPQNALYQQYLSQTQNQAGSQLANSGVSNTPYGQSVMGTDIGNFNIGWDTSQLGRATSALNTAAGAINTGEGTAQNAYQMGYQGPQQAITSSLLPFSTMTGGESTLLGGLTAGAQTGQNLGGLQQSSIQDYINYMNTGNQSNAIYNQGQESAANWNLAANQQDFNQMAQIGGGVVNAGSSLFGGMGPFGAFGAFAMA